MSRLADYLAFGRVNPILFVNPPDGGITILLDEDEIWEAEAQMAQWLESKGMPAQWLELKGMPAQWA